jgi:succinate dehydrogenase/fumarate reductase-like Fe-S protein
MISPKEDDLGRIPDLEGIQVEQTLIVDISGRCLQNARSAQAHLHPKAASIDVVTKKEIRVLRHTAADFEQLHQIILCTQCSQDGEQDLEQRTYCPWISPQTVVMIDRS